MDGTHIIPITTPDKSAAPQHSDTDSLLDQLRQYFMSNLMTAVWNGFLFVGGLVFLRYFSSIGFMPELDLPTSLTFLAASALTGGLIIIILTYIFFIPGLLWRIITDNNEKLEALWHDGEQFVLWRAFLWVGLPFVGIVASWLSPNFLPRSGIVNSLVIPSVLLYLLILGYFLLRKKPLYNIPCILRRRIAAYWLLGHLLSAVTFFIVILGLSPLLSLVPNLEAIQKLLPLI